MYQQYPGTTQMPQAERQPPPRQVVTASGLMYAGAVASLVYGAGYVISRSALKTAIAKHGHNMTATQVTNTAHVLVTGGIVGAVIAAGLWVFMARACLRGRKWARIVSSVLFGYFTLQVLVGVALPVLTVTIKVLALLMWAIGLVVIILLWRRPSAAFFS